MRINAIIKVITKALRKFEGSIIVVSHDRPFLEELNPTHVLTIRNQRITFEERSLNDNDWNDQLNSRDTMKYIQKPSIDKENPVITMNQQHDHQKQITKMEKTITKYEVQLNEIDAEMFQVCHDYDALVA
jgi:ATPase subunit of ABC transporter with duplicated ATPase domains